MINIKRISIAISLFIIIFFFVGCSDTNTQKEEWQVLEKKYNDNIENYNLLKESYDILVKEKNELQGKYNSLLDNKQSYDSYYDYIKTDKIERLLTEINFLYEEIQKYPKDLKDITLLNMYNEELINQGDIIGDFQVSNISKKNVYEGVKVYSIFFEGEFVVEGNLYADLHGGAIGLSLSNEEVKKIPHSYFQRENGMFFLFDPNSAEFIKSINKEYPNINTEGDLFRYLQNNDKEITMKARFNNLIVNYYVGKYVSDGADLVEVLEIK